MDNLSKRENTIKMACEFEDFEDYIAYLNRQPKQRLDYFISRESFEKQMAEAILKEKRIPKNYKPITKILELFLLLAYILIVFTKTIYKAGLILQIYSHRKSK